MMDVYVIKGDDVERQDGSVIEVAGFKGGSSDVYFEKYGFPISGIDLDKYESHSAIWLDFIKSDSEVCMIIERGVTLKVSLDFIKQEIAKYTMDWDVLFPYNKLEKAGRDKYPKLFTSKFGVYWGYYFYFITKSGCRKMLELDERNLPLDESILDLSYRSLLNSYFTNTLWFQYDDFMCPVYVDRLDALKHAIFNVSAYSPEEKDIALKIVRDVSEFARRESFSLFLHAGTLLGSIRQGSIMPWDDDIDLMINALDVEAFVKRLKAEGVYQVTQHIWKKTGRPYYKIWLLDGVYADGYEYSFPFVDIWILYPDKDDMIYTTDGYEFAYSTYYPLKPVLFEGCQLQLPNRADIILDSMYSGWRNMIKVYTWCHKLKNHSFRGLQLPIKVDEYGRLIPE